jgi:hypothetical protein
MLDIYAVGGVRWNELLDLAREAQRPGWWKAYGLGNNSYIAFETEASHVQVFTLGYAPGLMQTADYVRALMRAVPVRRTAEELENEVAARMYRQQRLTSAEDPLELVTVIDESALYRPVGGSEVLRGQLEQIAVLADLDTVKLSETFFEQLRRHPVPIEEAAIKALSNNSMALDVYCWLTYRLHVLQSPKPITWKALQSPGWNDARLARLQAAWERLDLLSGLELGLAGERAAGIELFRFIESLCYRIAMELWIRVEAESESLADAVWPMPAQATPAPHDRQG